MKKRTAPDSLQELYLGGEELKKEEVLPDDFKNFFVNFVRYLFGRGKP